MAASVECNLREQHALDTAGVGIVFIRQRVIVRCNRRCADIFGYPDEHALWAAAGFDDTLLRWQMKP
ncbi:PAS domain-containing protein, partial [Delftia tsuruhatensis]|uniref:PAS domain-containing protein n=1 Tax=Delftia tsuruhatensis TaxID=180282 RepID=UPI002027B1F5